jgi:hypothetical protein
VNQEQPHQRITAQGVYQLDAALETNCLHAGPLV